MVRFRIQIRLPSLLNERLHWRQLAALKEGQRWATRLCLRDAVNRGAELPAPPLLVTITRVGPRRLDDDNLQAACKYVRDEVAAQVGVDDGSDQYTWRYEQRIGDYAVEVEITQR